MISGGEEMILKRVAGGSITEHRPIFSSDSMSLFVVWEDGVRQYSVRTGQCLQQLETPTSAPVVCLQTSPVESSLLYGISSKGELLCWRQEDGLFHSLKDLVLDLPEEKEIVGFYITSHNTLVIIVDDQEKSIQKYILYNLDSREKDFLPVIGQLGQFSSSVGGFNDDEFLATVHAYNLRVINLKTLKKYKHMVNPDWGAFTCVRAHQKQQLLATCDAAGRILVWRDFTSESAKAVKSLHHWHKLPVNDVVFTAQASCFYSGGAETVLVKWWTDNDTKDFLTNMGATIKNLAVSPDNKYVAAAMQDNAIHIIDPRLKYHQTIQHVAVNFEQRKGVQPQISRLTFDPRTKALILNGRPGHVQFFSVERQEYLFQVDVVNQNYLNQERGIELINTEVVLTVISADGSWMATLEQRDDRESHVESRVKFWKWHWQHMFKLSTSIENPHQGKINDMAFQPTDGEVPKFVTTGANGKFVVWRQSTYDESWKYEFVGTFDQKIPRPVNFSRDGSLFGVGFGSSLTVWSAKDHEMKSCLSRPGMSDNIKIVEFGNCEASRYVICATDSSILIWDLLKLQLKQRINTKVCCLASNPLNSQFAAFTEKREVIVFTPCSNKPVFRQRLELQSSIKSAVFWPLEETNASNASWQRQALLYFITEEQEVFTLVRNSEGGQTLSRSFILPSKDESQFASPLAALISTQTASEVRRAEPAPLWQQQVASHQGSYLKMMCETPAHMMPPLQLLVGELVQEFLRTQCSDWKEELDEKGDQALAMEVDEEASSDSDDEATEKIKKLREVKEEEQKLATVTRRDAGQENSLLNVVQEDTKWVELLFDSMRGASVSD